MALKTGSRTGAYLLTRAEVVRAGRIDRLGAEKQATLVEYWFANAYFDSDANDRSAPRSPVRDELVCKSMLDEVKAARPLSNSYILEEAAWGPGMRSPRLLDDADPDPPGVPLLRIEF